MAPPPGSTHRGTWNGENVQIKRYTDNDGDGDETSKLQLGYIIDIYK